mmetsp:Transcript_40220/g.86259  ORF Transcript_40220/g.86259 Transcript_40220/m.86259 type:complete len:1349 (+) Transcript_40220:1-4047(+)
MMDFGDPNRGGSLFDLSRLPDFVRVAMDECDVVCLGVVAAEGTRCWAQLYQHDRRIVVKLVQTEASLAHAREAKQLLAQSTASFTALRILHENVPHADLGKNPVFDVLKEAEQDCLSKLIKLDKNAGIEALRTLIKIHRSFTAEEEILEMTLLVEPMLRKDVVEAMILSGGLDLRLLCDFLVAFISQLRQNAVITDAKIPSHFAEMPFLLFKRVLHLAVQDTEALQHFGLEAAFLLLEPDQEGAMRRWVMDGKNCTESVLMHFRHWCCHKLCAYVQPWMESGFDDATIGKRATNLCKPGKLRIAWTYNPAKSYFRNERGLDRDDRDLIQLLQMYLKMASWMPGGFSLMQCLVENLDDHHPFTLGPLEKLMPYRGVLRQSLLKDFERGFGQLFPSKNLEAMLGCRSLFDETFFSMVKGLHGRSEEQYFYGCFWELVNISARLSSLRRQEGIEAAIDEVKEMLEDVLTRKSFTKLIRAAADIDDVGSFVENSSRADAEPMLFTFDKLRACGSCIHESCLALQGDLSSRMLNNFDSVLDEILKAPPLAWLPLLKNLDTIFLALKYQDQEDLAQNYSRFRSRNLESKEYMAAGFNDLLSCVEQVFRKPLFETKGLDILEENLDLAKLVQERAEPLTEEVRWRTPNGETIFGPEDWQIVLDIITAQLENMRRRMKVFLKPHHTQITTLLMFGFLVCAAQQGNEEACKTVLAEMGTGEGKSWVIAMLAAFVAKKGMRAHVLVDNAALLQRDFSVMKEFFGSLSISMAIADKKEDALLDPACRVVYSTAHNIDRVAKHAVQKGMEPNASEGGDAILIVDEVDGLVIDNNPYVHWLTQDESTAGEFKAWAKARTCQVEVSGFMGDYQQANGVYEKAGKCGSKVSYKHQTENIFVYSLGDARWCVGPSLGGSEVWAESNQGEAVPRSGDWVGAAASMGAPNIKVGTLDAIKASSMDPYTKNLFKEFKDACNEALTKVQGIHYQISGKNLYLLDSVTKSAKPHSTDMWLEVMRSERNSDYDFSFMAVQTVVSKVLCHQTYVRIFGLTGSIGGAAEKNFIKQHYGAVVFQCPSFLDTVPSIPGKRRPVLREASDALQPNEEAQIARTVEMAAANFDKVPVLIISENPRMRDKITAALKSCSKLPEEYTDRTDVGIVEVKSGAHGNDDFMKKVELATKPVMVTENGRRVKMWPISVTTPEGGRGHDFRTIDSTVDKRGGLFVIVTWIPDSLRDWMQFKGRTARQDKNGQYAVVLNAETQDIDPANLRGAQADDIITLLMDASNAKTATKLDGYSSMIPKANVMHRFSVKFWHLMKDKKLSTVQQQGWIQLCSSYRSWSEEEVEQHWKTKVMGTAPAVDES